MFLHKLYYLKFINFLSKQQDSFEIIKKLKSFFLNFIFFYRHKPFQETKKIFITKKYYIEKFSFDIFDYSHVSQLIFANYEKSHFQFYIKNFSKGEIFIDIGSNIGIHSFFVLKFLNPFRVYSIEPQPLCVNLQKKTLYNNKELAIKNRKIFIINKAINNKNKKLKIFRNNSGSGTLNNDFGNDYIEKYNQNIIKIGYISVKKIFGYLKKDKKITIKIDTQGSELFILQEIYKTKNLKNIKNIIFEVNKENIEMLRIVLTKYLKEFKLINFNLEEVSLIHLRKNIKACLILTKKDAF
jgi:FkbM family methyltransferase